MWVLKLFGVVGRAEPEVITEDYVYSKYCDSLRCEKICDVSMKLSIVLAFAITTMAVFYFIKATSPSEFLSFVSDGRGKVERVTPYRNPPVNDQQALRWASERANELLSIHFRDYALQISTRKNYFLGEGWFLYQKSLIEGGVIKEIKDNSLVVTSVHYGRPRIISKYYLHGSINWEIQIPILQTVRGASDKTNNERMVVSMNVLEVNRDQALQGLKIRTFNVIK